MVRENLAKSMASPTSGGVGGGNLMQMFAEANMAAGADMGDVDLSKYGVKTEAPKAEPKPKNSIDGDMFNSTGENSRGRLVNDPKWHIIAQAFIAIEDARTINEMVQTIDHLNDLQHNSFHVLIDLQSGRMLEGQNTSDRQDHGEAVNIVKEVLDIKMEATTPVDYRDRLTSPIRKILNRNK